MSDLLEFLLASPHEPMATPAEVLEAECPLCGSAPGVPCDFSRYRFSLLGLVLRDFSGLPIHTKRYLAKTHDPR